jgi:hypothetical protein
MTKTMLGAATVLVLGVAATGIGNAGSYTGASANLPSSNMSAGQAQNAPMQNPAAPVKLSAAQTKQLQQQLRKR